MTVSLRGKLVDRIFPILRSVVAFLDKNILTVQSLKVIGGIVFFMFRIHSKIFDFKSFIM